MRNISHKQVKFKENVNISQVHAKNTASYPYNDIYLENMLKLTRTVNISQKATKYISKRIDAIMAPLWTSATWWHLIAPDAFHFSEFVVDWVWLPKNDPSLFVQGAAQNGRAISPPSWRIMPHRAGFSLNIFFVKLCKRVRCIQEGCRSCSSNSWKRYH